MRVLRRVAPVVLTLLLASCQREAPRPEPTRAARETPAPRSGNDGENPAAEPAARPKPERPEPIDVHVHLVGGHVDELLATLDRHQISAAVVLASPHLDPDFPPPPGPDKFAGWRAANERLLEQTRAHRDRLLPFVSVDPAQVEAEELEGWFDRGACGVKLYIGHHSLHPRPLDDPAYAPSFALLEQRAVPVLLHVNTVRYEDEFDALLRAYPNLELVCPHLCGSRTDLDRLERLLAKHPRLRVDTSHGEGRPGVDGFTNLERERERLRALITAQPQRFLYGSDLVTLVSAGTQKDASLSRWRRQIDANLGLLAAERFEFLRDGAGPAMLTTAEYRGLALAPELLESVLAGNARSWLGACLEPADAKDSGLPPAGAGRRSHRP
ncbi:amidohydrolase family protein [Enhygromyxa salina]|uniref:Amidohydrolase n=1 Tax=Enhygromyxa salina TaxID=215803 RepID=A0A2S9YU31_9BACT|nr:amidohydrolase family protein [Enhygromyxa salina]PRQ08542.1 Amidohydrolase [Enhygromyxa salina]